MVLEAYSNVLSFIASSATIPLLLSPTLICNEFIKIGSSDHIKPFLFVGGLVRCILFLQFGILMKLKALVITHSFGTILYSIYLSIYYIYCKNKTGVESLFVKAVVLVSVLLGFVNLKTESYIANYYGVIVTAIHLSLLGAPLLNLKNIINARSTAGLPFPLIFCANIVSTSWLLYGISINNATIIFQMLVGTILTGTQLSLFVIYPSKRPDFDKKEK